MSRVYNFSPGPAMLPTEVLEQAQSELLDWNSTGMSVMEISHRSPSFRNIANESEQDLRDLLSIPDNYKVLFLHGGARSQFAMVPMNLMNGNKKAAYVDFGVWGRLAIKEAQLFGEIKVIADTQEVGYQSILPQDQWRDFSDCAYVYVVDNETVNGVEFSYTPDTKLIPLVSDMSSNLLSREFDVSQYGVIFACAQKLLGPAGITVVLLREDLLDRGVLPGTPSMFNYNIHVDQASMLNTSPTYSWYLVSKVLKWVKSQGGVAEMEARNKRKAAKLYSYIDSEDFYLNMIKPDSRSKMNIIFQLHDESLNESFLNQADRRGLVNLKGHRLVGGMRASIYNAMPESGVDALIEFMQEFAASV